MEFAFFKPFLFFIVFIYYWLIPFERNIYRLYLELSDRDGKLAQKNLQRILLAAFPPKATSSASDSYYEYNQFKAANNKYRKTI